MSHELYKKYRPKLLKHIVGQDAAVKALSKLLANGFPHATLFSGPSGCGKTTAARIIKSKLGCSDEDCVELDFGQFRGIDTVRDIRQQMQLYPMSGKCRMWICDEIHRATGDSLSAMLKILEDTPDHVYFILATTDPQKLLPTIRTRCTEIKLQPIESKILISLIKDVAGKEGKTVTDAVAERIAEVAEGSARKSLVLLGQVIDLETEEGQLKQILSNDTKKNVADLCQALLKKATWWTVSGIIARMNEEPETIRRGVLGYMSDVVMKGHNKRGLQVIANFGNHWYDCGRAGLILCCGELCEK